MKKQLQEIFGQEIQIFPYDFPKKTPIYIRDGYTAQKILMDGDPCIVVTPVESDLHLPGLKKQYANIQKLSDVPVVLNLRYLTAGQRKNLIESRIPFISLPYQVYLPFWGCMFMNRFNTHKETAAVMPWAAQLLYLYLLYRGADKPVMHKVICDELGFSKAGGTRAIQLLADLGLIGQKSEGTKKWITPAAGSIEDAMKVMGSPVQKNLYLKKIPEGIPYKYGGIRALSMRSMITTGDHDGSIVFSKAAARSIPKDLVITSEEFADFGGIRAEVWSYDPFLLSSGETVDDISLLLTLQHEDDERIQKELDPVRSRYGIKI